MRILHQLMMQLLFLTGVINLKVKKMSIKKHYLINIYRGLLRKSEKYFLKT